MPISAVIHLSPPEDATLRPTMGHHAHAVFLSLLRIGNPKQAQAEEAARHIRTKTVHRLATDSERHPRHRDSVTPPSRNRL